VTALTLVVGVLVAGCRSGEQRTGAPATDTVGQAPTPMPATPPADTAMPRDTARAKPATPAATPAPALPARPPQKKAAVPAQARAAPKAATPSPPPDTAPLNDPYHPAPKDTLASDVYNGWKQYELNCSRCHGEYGVGTSFAPALVASLKDAGTIPTKELFIVTVCGGRKDKGMPAWCELGLEMDKIQWIYGYLKGRADGKISPGRPALRGA
jgi:mono/diheme cytochrome c family protein